MPSTTRAPASTRSIVRTAVIPTTFDRGLLPATKSVPIELLPLAGVPVIERIVSAASGVGLTDVLLITNTANRSIEDHFDHDLELERRLVELDDRPGLVAVRRAAALATVHSIRQRQPLGLGDALRLACTHVGGRPFAVLAPDRLVEREHELLETLLAASERSEQCAVAVPREVDPRRITAHDLERYGRYVLTDEVFEALSEVSPDLTGRRRLGSALLRLARRGRLELIGFTTDVCDVGDRLDRLRVELELLLADPSIGSGVDELVHATARRHDRHPPPKAAA